MKDLITFIQNVNVGQVVEDMVHPVPQLPVAGKRKLQVLEVQGVAVLWRHKEHTANLSHVKMKHIRRLVPLFLKLEV